VSGRIEFDFKDKVVVITGGSRGLGHSMALGFAHAGANLAIASRKLDSCEATVAEIRALGRDASAHAIHVGKWEDCNRLADEVYARWGRADVLINNAGLSPLAPSSVDTNEDLFDKVIGVNLKGPFRLSALFGSEVRAIPTTPRTKCSLENSACSGWPEPPVPVPVGSPPCAIKPPITRWKTVPS